jgi:hypothetical protein
MASLLSISARSLGHHHRECKTLDRPASGGFTVHDAHHAALLPKWSNSSAIPGSRQPASRNHGGGAFVIARPRG